MRRLVPLLLLLAGCGGGPEATLVGTWVLSNGSTRVGQKGATTDTITFAQDKTYAAQVRGADLKGTWALQEQKVTLTPTTFSGKPIAERAAELRSKIRLIPAGVRKASEEMVRDLEAKRVLEISADAKTLSANEGSWTGMSLAKR